MPLNIIFFCAAVILYCNPSKTTKVQGELNFEPSIWTFVVGTLQDHIEAGFSKEYRLARGYHGIGREIARMSPQSEGRPSVDRYPGDGACYNRGDYRQQQGLESNQSQLRNGRANGHGSEDPARQRFLGPSQGAGDTRNANGSLPHSPSDGRNGRSRDVTQDLPVRERSRNSGAPGSKSSHSAPRLCQKCEDALTGQFVRALGGTFHLDCFRCRVSRKHFTFIYTH